MSLVSLKELLETANKNNFAVGYFEAWDLYSLEAVALAAEKEKIKTEYRNNLINKIFFFFILTPQCFLQPTCQQARC